MKNKTSIKLTKEEKTLVTVFRQTRLAAMDYTIERMKNDLDLLHYELQGRIREKDLYEKCDDAVIIKYLKRKYLMKKAVK